MWNQDYSRVVEEHEKIAIHTNYTCILEVGSDDSIEPCTNAKSGKMKLHEMEFDDFTNEVLRSIRKPREPNYDQSQKN